MKNSRLKHSALDTGLAILVLFGVILFARPDQANAGDPLMDRDGRTFTVAINGTETTRIAKRKIMDGKGAEAYEVFWTASAPKGPLCFKITPHDPRLGAVEKIDVLIFEINKERENQRWKSYDTVPSPTEQLAAFATDKGFCPTEYTLTERLRYPALPPGQYVFRIAYWGVGNWDRQDIEMTISE